MAVLTLDSDITGRGLDQGSLVQLLTNLVTVVNELVDDHATMVTLLTELKADIGTTATFQAALTAKLDADTGVTDADYASTLTEVVAVTAAVPASLTNSTDLTLNGG